MYEDFYGLTEKPFSIQPDPSFLYWGRGHRLAYAMLEYGVVNQAGISVITGEVGCGKTTLIHRLLDQLSDTHTIALLSNIQAGRGELLSWVLMGFGEPYAGKTHVEMFAQLQSFFIREYAKGKRVVLIIDEAQNLSIDMLEELRMLSNINAGKDQLLQLILVGQPQLKDLLSRPEMLQLAQRIGSDFHLTPLTREEVHAYIETRLSIAGSRRNIFTQEAMDLIAEHSRGVPRVINTIADTALVYAFSAQDEQVSGDMVRSVIRDKLDYGVFGLASSPDLKLAEGDARRRPSGFIREEERERPAEMARSAAPARAAGAAPRLVSNLDVQYVADEPAALVAVNAPAPPATGGHARFETPAPRPAAAKAEAARPVRSEETLVAMREAPPAAPSAAAAHDEIGVIIVKPNSGLLNTVRSVPAGAAIVVVALAGSDEAARVREAGLELVEMDADSFSGGRARNAGYRRLKKNAPNLKLVQYVDAGVELAPDWFGVAARFMARRPEVAVLEGRIDARTRSGKIIEGQARSRKSDDDGEVQAAGSVAIFRADAFEGAGGFRGDIVADETADLCIRLRRRGAHVWRSEEAMASAPAGGQSLAGWRARAVDDGYAYAAGAALHGGPPERYCAREQARAVMWGAIFPVLVVLSAIVGGVAVMMMSIGVNPVIFAFSILAAGALIYGLKIAAFAASAGLFRSSSWAQGAAMTIRHFYECVGVLRYWFSARKGAGARKAVA